MRNGQWYAKKILEAYQGANLIESFFWELDENYANNILTGKLIYKENQNLPLELNFNKKGGLVGDYLLNYAGKLRLSTNQQGIVTRYEHSGKQEIITNEALSIGENYVNGMLTQEQAESQNFSIVKKYLNEYFFSDNVFYEDAIKSPDDGENRNGLENGYYVLALYSQSLSKLNQLKSDNDKRLNEENFRNIFETGNILILKEMYSKEKNIITKRFNSNSCNNINFLFSKNSLEMKTGQSEKDRFDNITKCVYRSNGNKLSVQYDYEKEKILIKTDKGDSSFNVIKNGSEVILDSPTDKITLYIPSGPEDFPSN